MGKSNISYLDAVWNPITGCSGKGCQAYCYAKEMVRRFPAIHGEGPFNEVQFHPDRLEEPLRWRKPRVVGVGFFGDMGDNQVKYEWFTDVLFHASLPDCEQHQFVFLTKQPKRFGEMVRLWAKEEAGPFAKSGRPGWEQFIKPNWWFGTTVCNQAEANGRIPELLKVPGKKWISIEPMLGPVDLSAYLPVLTIGGVEFESWPSLIILGGESGPKARPLHPDWVRSVQNQCAEARVPFYFKQWGEWAQSKWASYSAFDKSKAGLFQTSHIVASTDRRENGKTVIYPIPPDYDGSATGIGKMERVGLKAAGRMLDGVIHDELPWRVKENFNNGTE